MAVGKDWLLEAKSTVSDSLSIRYSWLGKISNEALIEGKRPALSVSFVDRSGRAVNFGDWVLVPRKVFDELRGEVDGVCTQHQDKARR